MVQPGVREISPLSIYGEAYGGIEELCLSLKRKREEVTDGDRGGDDSVDQMCVVVKR